ncbi:hypothetical protein X777_13383 [Ooceraea biroi]|uniref:Uncharacterized protein n=1 Tax=Ooceraea biroi TaxID=2015173 RepID=A0A026WYS5_OOCBI|nr:hypothetical protein X777_13383 [Ooceraea biroi]
MRQYFTNNPKSLGSLIKALLNNVLRHSSCPNASSEDKILETHRELSSVQSYTIIKVIESLTQIYKLSVTMRDELRSIFIQDILYPMCELAGHRCTNNTNKFGIVACKCIQQLLLEQNRSAQYKQIMDSSQTFSDLFSVLSKNVETLDLRSNLLTYQVIFHAVISSYKSDAASLDKFFRNLVNSAGRYKWEILNTYLKLLNDVTLDFDNVVDDITLSEYFQKLISDILTCNMTHTQYGVLAQLAYINPLLIERNVSGILDKILMDEETTDHTNLLIAILHASTKLRREQKFIMQLLMSLKGQIATRETCKVDASTFFPYELKTKLIKTISNFSNKQAIAILRTLIYYLNTDCLKLLQCDSSCKNVLILKATKLLMEENDKVLEVLQVIKELISQKQWVQVANDTSSKIILHLKILSLLPTIYLGPNVRTLLFLAVYSVSRECEANDTVLTLCNMIFSELLEKPGIDIFQYVEPTILINQLTRNKAFSKACEFSFRNVTTYDILKSLIKSCVQCKEVMCILLESMEIVKPKLDTEQKAIFKKAEKKLAKAILKFDNTLLEHSVQLAVIVLRHRKTFEVEDAIIKSLWSVMLRHPCKNLLELLLESTGPKEFDEFLKVLYDKTINSLSQTDETTWTNLFVIWSGIMKVNMNFKRNKIRLVAVNSLLEAAELLDIPDKCWRNLLHLSHDIIGAKHLVIPNSMIDLIIIIGLKSLDNVKISSCENVLAICRTLINVRTNLITDKLPILLLLYRAAVNTIVHASKSVVDKFEEHRFTNLAFDIEKVTSLLIKLKKDMTRLSVYLIADLLQLIVEGTAPSYIKVLSFSFKHERLALFLY